MVNFNTLTVALLAAGASLVAAKPVEKRAGGPAIVPIPAECSLVSVSPLNSTTTAQHGSRRPRQGYGSEGPEAAAAVDLTFVPKASFLNSSRLYAWFADPGTFSNNASKAYEICLQQCYGFGSKADCRGVYFAQTYPAEPQFGGPGGWPSDACIMFKTTLHPDDLEAVPAKNGTALGALGTNILC